MTAALALEPVDVLKVAHHGSADPGLPALLERLKPRVAAIEVGSENRYGHPTPSTLAALKRAVPTVSAHRPGRHRAPARQPRPDVGGVNGSARGQIEPRKRRAGRPRSVARARASVPPECFGHGTVTPASGATIRLRPSVSRIPPRKGLLNREIATPCGLARRRAGRLESLAPAAHAEPSTTVVISKIMTRGPLGGNDEVIELKNKSAAPVAIGGWQLWGSNDAGSAQSARATITAGTDARAGGGYRFDEQPGRPDGQATRPTRPASPTTAASSCARSAAATSVVDAVGSTSLHRRRHRVSRGDQRPPAAPRARLPDRSTATTPLSARPEARRTPTRTRPTSCARPPAR